MIIEHSRTSHNHAESDGISLCVPSRLVPEKVLRSKIDDEKRCHNGTQERETLVFFQVLRTVRIFPN